MNKLNDLTNSLSLSLCINGATFGFGDGTTDGHGVDARASLFKIFAPDTEGLMPNPAQNRGPILSYESIPLGQFTYDVQSTKKHRVLDPIPPHLAS